MGALVKFTKEAAPPESQKGRFGCFLEFNVDPLVKSHLQKLQKDIGQIVNHRAKALTTYASELAKVCRGGKNREPWSDALPAGADILEFASATLLDKSVVCTAKVDSMTIKVNEASCIRSLCFLVCPIQ